MTLGIRKSAGGNVEVPCRSLETLSAFSWILPALPSVCYYNKSNLAAKAFFFLILPKFSEGDILHIGEGQICLTASDIASLNYALMIHLKSRPRDK
jgi:hypothetical protein